MSVVIGIKTKDGVVIGSDRQVTKGQLKTNLTGDNSKIWPVDNFEKIIMGGVGSLRSIQIIQTMRKMITLDELMDGIDYSFVVRNLYNKIFKELVDYGRIPKDVNGNFIPTFDCAFLFAIQNNLFAIEQDGSVIDTDDYIVIGSGEEVASGVLENNKDKDPYTRIKEAIKACSDKTLYVNNKIDFLTTIIPDGKETKSKNKKKEVK